MIFDRLISLISTEPTDQKPNAVGKLIYQWYQENRKLSKLAIAVEKMAALGLLLAAESYEMVWVAHDYDFLVGLRKK